MASECVRILIDRAKRGDRSAFEGVVQLYQDRLERLIGARLAAHGAEYLGKEDVFQQAVLQGFQALAGFQWRGRDSFLRWMGTIIENDVLLSLRGRARKREVPLSETHVTEGSSPSRRLMREERFERLQAALRQLSPEHRQVIVLTRLQGMKVRQVAEHMGRSPEAVMQLLHRALRKLKTIFGDTESFSLPQRPFELGR